MIKTSAPLDDIIRYAVLHSDPLHDTNNITPTSASVVGLALSKRAALSINALCDTPTIRVCAAPWTSVTDDNDLVSHLVSVYFTWYHPAYPCVIQDLFVEAMNSQQLGTTFCCPLLVNSILAIACVCVVSISFRSRADFTALFRPPWCVQRSRRPPLQGSTFLGACHAFMERNWPRAQAHHGAGWTTDRACVSFDLARLHAWLIVL